jgi:hypothetical protein
VREMKSQRNAARKPNRGGMRPLAGGEDKDEGGEREGK